MTKKIFGSIAFMTALIFTASIVLIMGVLYTHFLNEQFGQMKTQACLAAQGVSKSGADYFKGLRTSGYRLTWIDPSGKVVYDSDAKINEMENHLHRDEIQQALKEGEGESSRYSTTLLERRLYVAKKVSDGSIIRISDSQHSILGLLIGMLHQILIIAVIGLGVSFLLAWRLTRRVIKPLNEIDLNKPGEITTYKELQPLVDRVEMQQDQIAFQTRQLQQKQQEFEVSTDNMEEGLLILNEEGMIISMNKAAAGILGISSYAAGRNYLEITDLPELSDAFRKAMSNERSEIPMKIAGRLYQLHSSPVRTGEKVTAAVIFILDISQRFRAEKMRREFTANVSHELKTPLQTISGSAELLSEGLVKQEDTAQFAKNIYIESRRLISLIDDIIGLSQLDEQTWDLRKEKIDLLAVAERTVRRIAPEAAESGVKVTCSGESAVVLGDITLLNSIVHNLCDNAVKYSKEHGSVSVSVQNEDNMAALTVSDKGIGIPAEDQDRIFERFYRVDKSRSKAVGGTGLGLSIVKHAVQLHNGQIALESVPENGTTVTVRIPLAD